MTSSLESVVSRPSSGVASPPQRMHSRSRTHSISSDRPSTVAHSFMSPPLAVSPEAAFIAASAASQIITNDHDSHAETWYDEHGIEPSAEPAAVSPAALQLVNNFLDQLLFNFLSVSRSTAISALRPAVSEVLKPKLAKDVINQADEELREYLGGSDEDVTPPRDSVSPTDWDLELAWKRTRLRCMVYSSLGDMEEEDEDFYMEQGHLDSGLDERLSEVVSPAVAIFLTSILEFIGEQALIVAGQAAYHRIRLKYEKELKEGVRSPTGIADRIVVEELDMERVALDRTLGRLWRTWKKKIRSPGIAFMDRLARSYSRDSMRSAASHLRSPSSAAELAVPATVPEPEPETEKGNDAPQSQVGKSHESLDEDVVAASIPLPLGPNDVAEIEVPGLAHCSDDESEDDDTKEKSRPARPKSLMILPLSGPSPKLMAPSPSHPHTPAFTARKRSNSVPAPATTRYVSPVEAQLVGQTAVNPVENRTTEGSEIARGGSEGASDEGEEIQSAETKLDSASGEHVSRTAPQTEEDEKEDETEDDEDEVSVEEPRIVRSSRVSILGRSSSLTLSDRGKLSAINTNLPNWTPSIHSARLIDVTSPRSPALGSQRSSVVAAESIRQPSPSPISGTGTPPIPEDRARQSSDSASGSRLNVNRGTFGRATNESTSGAEEAIDNGSSASPASPVTPASQSRTSLPTIPEPVSRERYESAEPAAQPPGCIGSDNPHRIPRPSTPGKPVARPAVLPTSTASPASTLSASSSTGTSGTFFIESMPVLPEGRDIQPPPREDSLRYRPSPTPPAVPERSAGRQAVANTSAHRQPATIGQVSVERSRARTPSEPSSSRPQEPATGQSRQQQASGSPSSTKFKAVRTSEEGMQARIDVVRDFEELIQSDQTIQYTLTPESMRNIEPQPTRPMGTGSPAMTVKPRKSEDSRQNGDRSRSSSIPRPNDVKTSTSSPRSAGSVSQSDPVADAHPTNNRSFSTGTGKHGGVVPRSTPPVPSKPRASSGPQARDARLPRESLAEFAEFIRSTGPSGDRATPANASSGPGKAPIPASISKAGIEAGRASTASSSKRLKLQAREAAVDYKDDNSDLIDFIRRGPPSTPGNPRIPRAVAPFRTTMDSDQLSGAVGGKAVDAQLRDIELRSSSQTSTNVTDSSVPPSIQSSVNSHSALLQKTKPVPSYGGDDDMPIPKRKTRRVRDPYAIDISDEELEDDDVELAQLPKRRAQTQEESLIDFLNNYKPPPEPPVQPFNISAVQARNNKPKKKASAPSLMARLTRRDYNGQAGNLGSAGSETPRATTQMSAESRGPRSRAATGGGRGGGGGGGGHVPIQVNMPPGLDAYAPQSRANTPKAMATMGGASAAAATGGRVPMKKFEPREPIAVPSRATSDLAEFLRSGPPPGMMTGANQFPGPGPAERDEANGISRVFARRKKASVS
ncbi:hypothetical protein VTK56DRAFT_3718 [Thermocarpiscus australiensis]